MPRSESGRSGVPTRPSFRLSSYENEMRKRPYPFRWCGGSVRMHARLYLRRRCEQRRCERARRARGDVSSVGVALVAAVGPARVREPACRYSSEDTFSFEK